MCPVDDGPSFCSSKAKIWASRAGIWKIHCSPASTGGNSSRLRSCVHNEQLLRSRRTTAVSFASAGTGIISSPIREGLTIETSILAMSNQGLRHLDEKR